jgi:hypothetical protein
MLKPRITSATIVKYLGVLHVMGCFAVYVQTPYSTSLSIAERAVRTLKPDHEAVKTYAA